MSQIQFAKLAHISVGTLQGFEKAIRKTHDTNLLKIAAAIGLTLDELIREDDPPVRPDPHTRDLKSEDFKIAHAYHHSGADVKHALKRYFASATTDERRERIAAWIARLLPVDDDELAHLEELTFGAEYRPSTVPAATVPPPRTTAKTK
jgi:transcriptional regulator with XRE-family HTH domain